MIWHIAKKDFIDNFKSARFVIGFLLCLFLVPYTVYTGTRVYETRVAQYHRDLQSAQDVFSKAQVYGQIQPVVVIPPSPLSIFSKGISEQVGTRINLPNDQAPTFADGITNMYENRFLNRFMSLDFINIMAIMLSLIGMFLSYDLFSREKESGTLKLLLSHQVKRSELFLGKVTGILITFLPLLLICFMLVFVILWFSPAVKLAPDDYARISLVFVFSLLYLVFFVFLGSYISSKVKASSTSLVINLFIWCALLFLLPNTMVYLGKNMVKCENYSVVKLNMGEISNEFWKEQAAIEKQVARETGIQGHACNVCAGWNYGMIMMCFTPLDYMKVERRSHELTAPLVLEYADKKWQIQQAYLNQLYRQQRMIKYLSCISPAEILKYLSASLCKTDMETHNHVMDQARNYRQQFYDYYKSSGIYSSYSYFSPHKESEIPANWEEATRMYEEWKTRSKPESSFDLSSLKNADVNSLPRFNYQKKSIVDGLSDQLWLFSAMMITCLFLVWITYRSFIKYDIR